MLKKKELQQLQDLLERSDLRDKAYLKNFIWSNTTKEKFKVGDKVIFSDRRRTVQGRRVINFVGVITEVMVMSRFKIIQYGIKAKMDTGYEFNSWVQEEELKKTTRKDINQSGQGYKNEDECEIPIYL